MVSEALVQVRLDASQIDNALNTIVVEDGDCTRQRIQLIECMAVVAQPVALATSQLWVGLEADLSVGRVRWLALATRGARAELRQTVMVSASGPSLC